MSALGSYIAHIEALQDALTKRNARIAEIEKQRDVCIEIGVLRERERINGIIDQFIENSDYPEVVSSLEWLQDVIKGENE